MKTALHQLVRVFSSDAAHGKSKAARMPRSMRPHVARSTFVAGSEAEVLRHFAV